MIEEEGVSYLNAKEAARHLNLERGTFYANVKSRIERHRVGARRRWMYRITDLAPFSTIETVKPEERAS
jgi:hypothetical protein